MNAALRFAIACSAIFCAPSNAEWEQGPPGFSAAPELFASSQAAAAPPSQVVAGVFSPNGVPEDAIVRYCTAQILKDALHRGIHPEDDRLIREAIGEMLTDDEMLERMRVQAENLAKDAELYDAGVRISTPRNVRATETELATVWTFDQDYMLDFGDGIGMRLDFETSMAAVSEAGGSAIFYCHGLATSIDDEQTLDDLHGWIGRLSGKGSAPDADAERISPEGADLRWWVERIMRPREGESPL